MRLSLQPANMRELFTKGALNGAAAWLIYAITENMFSSVFPWLIKQAYVYKALHWGFSSLLLLFIYPLTGLMAGGLLSLLFSLTGVRTTLINKAEPSPCFPAIASLTIVFIFSINLVHKSIVSNSLSLLDRPVMLALLLSLIIMGLLLINAGSEKKIKKTVLLINPWTISFILVGIIWINEELLSTYSLSIKILLNAVYVFLTIFTSYIIQKTFNTILPRNTGLSETPSRQVFISLFFVAIVLIGINSLLVQKPLITSKPQNRASLFNGPNVFLIVLDTVRADHLSLYGYERETSPNLDKFAKESTLYTQAISPGNMTLSTHASIFTGYFARQHGAHDPFPGKGPGQPLNEKFDTLAEILSEKGYSTKAVVSNISFLSPGYGLHQGFQHYDNRSRTLLLGGTYPFMVRQGIRNALTYIMPPSTYDLVCRRAETINDSVFSLLKMTKEEKRPFFMFINYMDAHRPYIPPPPFDDLFPGKNDDFIPARYFFPMKKEIMTFKRGINEAEQNHLVSQYDGGIAYIDFHIGQLIEKLKDLHLYENSLIIITSDHGELFGNRNLIEHGISVYQGVIHVPLIVKLPGSGEGKVINEPISLVDIMPMVLNELEYANQEEKRPDNQVTRLSGYVVSESYPSKYHRMLHDRYQKIERALHIAPHKFISSTSGKREIYNLINDRDEKVNLYKADSDFAEEMDAALNKWLSSVSEFSGTKREIDKDALDRLKSLGYIQ